MTLGELKDKIDTALLEKPDRESLPVYFDTDARTFNYHMALIGELFVNDEPPMSGMEHVSLHEERVK